MATGDLITIPELARSGHLPLCERTLREMARRGDQLPGDAFIKISRRKWMVSVPRLLAGLHGDNPRSTSAAEGSAA